VDFDLTIRISSNPISEEDLLRKFEEWMQGAQSSPEAEKQLWGGQRAIIELRVEKIDHEAAT
jgi:hypothetical protein